MVSRGKGDGLSRVDPTLVTNGPQRERMRGKRFNIQVSPTPVLRQLSLEEKGSFFSSSGSSGHSAIVCGSAIVR